MQTTTQMTRTQHSHPVVFGRREAGCPRCGELSSGAPARRGWGHQKRQFEAAAVAAIRAHNCRAAGCGPVCTFGDA
jgi:hypothetical protein